jgi:peptidoglycan/LPS O-acetylase OafA/YrhL
MSKTSAFLDLVCAYRERMKVVLALCIAMGLLLGFSALFVGPGDDAFPILVLDVVLVGGSFVAFSGAYWYCTKREMDA